MHRSRLRVIAAAVVASASFAAAPAAAHAVDIYWLSNPTSVPWTAEQTSFGNPLVQMGWPTTNFPSCMYPVGCTGTIPPNLPIGSSNYSTNVGMMASCTFSSCSSAKYEATLTPDSGGSGSVNYYAYDPVIGPAVLTCSGSGGAICVSYAQTGVLGSTGSLPSELQSAAISNTVRVRNQQQMIVPVEVYAKTAKRAPLRIKVKRGAKTIGRVHATVSTNKPLQAPIATKDRVTRGLSGGHTAKLRVRLSHRLPSGRWVSHRQTLQGVQETKEMRSVFNDLGPVGLR